jgi:hypothetical protein
MTTLMERVEKLLDRTVEEADRLSVCLQFGALSHETENSLPTVEVKIRMQLLARVCPECKMGVTTPYGEWRNKPGQKSLIYICPSCYDAILEKNRNLG